MTTAAVFTAIDADLRAELQDAVHVVLHGEDEDVLLGCGCRAVLSAPREFGYGYVIGTGATDVVLVGPVDVLGWTARMHADAPHVRLWSLCVPSPALALGWRSDERLDLAAVDWRRETWDQIVFRGARRIDWKFPASFVAPARGDKR